MKKSLTRQKSGRHAKISLAAGLTLLGAFVAAAAMTNRAAAGAPGAAPAPAPAPAPATSSKWRGGDWITSFSRPDWKWYIISVVGSGPYYYYGTIYYAATGKRYDQFRNVNESAFVGYFLTSPAPPEPPPEDVSY